MLAEAALLGSAVAVDRLVRVQLHGLRLAVESVLEVGADDRGSRLGTQREGAVAAVRERVHLLVHDVGARARRPQEERGVLEDGRVDPPVAVESAEVGELGHQPLPGGLLGRHHVVRAARALDPRLLAHAGSARRSARNGFRASSAPRVVVGPWPG